MMIFILKQVIDSKQIVTDYLIVFRHNKIMPNFNKRTMNCNQTELPSDQKIFSVQELRDRGYSQYRVCKLVDEGKLVKLSKSYYENTGYCGEESDFYYIGAFTRKGVVCLLSASFYYSLTTFIPDSVDIAIPRKSKLSAYPDWPPLNVHYFTDERYSLGITRAGEGKNTFQIYDIEKTVTDIVFYKEKIGIEETKEILLNYLHRQDRNLNRLLEYARLMKCEKTIRGYLEVLV